jgi:hypothetical protein
MEPAEGIQALDLVVGRVTSAEPHAGARAKSALLALDLGPRGTAQSTLPVPVETAQELVGTQVACAIGGSDVVVLAVHSHAAGVVVLTPAQEVEDGSPVA